MSRLIFTQSDEYRKEIHSLIPGGAHTYSKGDDQFPILSPAAIKRGKGAWVWDLDDNKFLDCSMGLTSVSLGHAYPEVLERIKQELENGVNFQRPSHLERIMAKEFLSLIPCHDMIKFAKNGSAVTTAATKLARAHTGRKYIAFPGDHPFYSYDDWFIGKTDCPRGVPEEISALSLTFDSTDLSTLEKLFHDYPNQIACVISEPEKINHPYPRYAQDLIDLCHKNGALFIQDEMVTGFKTDFPGSITKLNVQPDLTTWGKGIANGFSFCALTGKKEIMQEGGINIPGQEKTFLISTTHGGETHTLAAGLATIEIFREKNVIKYNHSVGEKLIKRCRELIEQAQLEKFISLSDEPWLIAFSFKNSQGEVDNSFRTYFLQEMIQEGVLFQGAFVPCFSHGEEEMTFFTQAFDKCLIRYNEALKAESVQSLLVGPATKPVFRKNI